MAKFTANQIRLALQILRTLTPLLLAGVKLSHSQIQKRKTKQLQQLQPEEPTALMIFEIYEQQDLFRIARCGRQSTLKQWLTVNQIPYLHNSKNEIIAHRDAVAAGLGVRTADLPNKETEPEMYLGD